MGLGYLQQHDIFVVRCSSLANPPHHVLMRYPNMMDVLLLSVTLTLIDAIFQLTGFSCLKVHSSPTPFPFWSYLDQQ